MDQTDKEIKNDWRNEEWQATTQWRIQHAKGENIFKLGSNPQLLVCLQSQQFVKLEFFGLLTWKFQFALEISEFVYEIAWNTWDDRT